MSEHPKPEMQYTPSAIRTGLRWAAMGTTAAVFIGLMAAGISGLNMMASANAPVEAPQPVPVAAKAVNASDGYTIKERFVGRLEPARQTDLAFERAGLVESILVDEGAIVGAGDAIAHLDTAKLEAERDRLNARRRQLEAQLGLATVTAKRRLRLLKSGHDTVERYDQARYALGGIVAEIESVDASLKAIDVDVAKSVLRAPFAGKVGARMIDEGAVVSSGTAVIHVLETAHRQVRIGVSVEASGDLKVGAHYTLAAGGRPLAGTLVTLRPDLSTGTRTITALFDVGGAERIPFGEIIELGLERFVAEPGHWVPIDALSEGRKGLWTVFTLSGEGGERSVAREAVEVLHAEQARAFVRGTLTGGAMVVVNGNNRIVPGQRVALAASGE
ncbi:MAG: efflux RND transporter periplasmic adaptor subunit [Hyphomicrobiales bacterium]